MTLRLRLGVLTKITKLGEEHRENSEIMHEDNPNMVK